MRNYSNIPNIILLIEDINKESWPKGPGFGYPQRRFALLEVH
jgi:hypothetical protein